MAIRLREFKPSDADDVNAVAVAAFEQYRSHYSDWPALADGLSRTAELAEVGELIVAEAEQSVVGAVAYIGPHKPKSSFFEPQWPIMRMLVVSPKARGLGVGRALAEECIARARRDGAAEFALHTTPIMKVALAMYERMGFTLLRSAPTMLGVSYGIYIKRLGA